MNYGHDLPFFLQQFFVSTVAHSGTAFSGKVQSEAFFQLDFNQWKESSDADEYAENHKDRGPADQEYNRFAADGPADL